MVTAERLNIMVSSDGVGGTASKFTDLKSALTNTKLAVGGVGGALAALSTGAMAKSVSVASSFQDSLVEIQKVTSPQTMRAMSTEIKKIAETTPLAQTAIASITEDAARFGIRGKKALTSFTKTVSKMSVATDLSASEAGESLAKLAKLTHTPISSVDRLGSSINTLANTAATSSSEVVDSMMRAAGVLSQAGLKQTDIAGLSASINEVSESSERAGTRLRRLGQEVFSSTGKKAQTLGQAIFGMNVPAEKAAQKFLDLRKKSPLKTLKLMAKRMKGGGKSAQTLNSTLTTVSRQALSGLGQNLKGLNKNLKNSRQAFKANNSLQKEFKAQSKTLSNQVQLLKNRITNLGISIGTVLLKPLTDVVKGISKAVSVFSKFNSKLGGMPAVVGLVTTAVTGLTAAAVALGPTISSTVVPVLSTMATALGTLLVPIAAVSAAFIAYKKNLFGFRDAVNSVSTVIRGKLLGLVRELRTVWNKHFGEIRDETLTTLALLKQRTQQFVSRVQGFWRKHGQKIMTIVNSAWSLIKGVVKTGLDFILTTVSVINDLIQGDFSEAWSKIKAFVTRTVSGIVTWLKNDGKAAFLAAVDLLVTGAKGTFDWLKRNVPPVVKNAIGAVVKYLKNDALTDAKNAFQFVVDGIVGVAKGIVTKLMGGGGGSDGGGGIIPGLFSDMATYLKGPAKKDIKNAFYALGKGIRTTVLTFFKMSGKLGKVIKDFLSGVAHYLKNDAKGDLKTAAKIAFKAVLAMGEWLKTQIIGEDGIVRSMVSDIGSYLKNDAWSDLKKAAEVLVGAITAAFEGLYDGLIGHSLVPDMIGDIASYLKNDAAKDLKKAAKEAAGDMAHGFVNKFNKIMPDDIPLPSATIGGGSFMGKHIPEKTFGGGSINVPKLAEGGIVDSPTLAMIGEAGPEAVVPLDKKNNPAGGGTTVNIYGDIHADDAEDFARQLERSLDAETR